MAIKISGLTKKYGEKTVLDRVSLSLPDTGMVFVLGASGAGKSTLLHILSSFDKDYAGSVQVSKGESGTPIEIKEEKKQQLLREYYDFIFQDYNLIHSLSVEENIKLSIELSEADFDADRYEEILTKLEIKELEKRNVRDLSGGEKQRTAIARALLRNSPMIFADEPTGNLDRKNGEVIFGLLKELSKTKLVLIVSHNEEAAQTYGDRIIRISDGRILSDTEETNEKQEQTSLSSEKQALKKERRYGYWIWKCIGANFKFRKKKWIPLFLILTLCLSSFGMALGLKAGLDRAVTELTYKTMECDQYEFLMGKGLISTEGITWLETDEKIEKAMIFDTYHLDLVYPEGIAKEPNYVIMDDSETFQNRYQMEAGTYPEEGQIMLSPNAATELFGTTACIGKTVVLKVMGTMVMRDGRFKEQGLEFTVSGVTATTNDIQGVIYIPAASAEELFLTQMYAPCYGAFELNNWKDFALALEDKNQCPENDLLVGRLPEEDSEVAVNAMVAKSILIKEGILESYSDELSAELVESLIGTELELWYQRNPAAKVTVVGVEKEKGTLILGTLYVNRKLEADELKYLSRSAMLYLNDISEEALEELEAKAVKNGANYGLNRMRAHWAGSVLSSIEVMVYIMAAVTVLMLVITICMVYYATKMSIMERSYEMGVIRSLGAAKSFVFRIFFTEMALLGVITAVVSGGILLVLQCSNVLQMYQIPILNIQLPQLGLLLIVGVCIVLLSSIVEIIKVANMPIKKAIGEKHI